MWICLSTTKMRTFIPAVLNTCASLLLLTPVHIFDYSQIMRIRFSKSTIRAKQKMNRRLGVLFNVLANQ